MKHELGQHTSNCPQVKTESTQAGKKRNSFVCDRRKTRWASRRGSRSRRPVTGEVAALMALLMFVGSISVTAEEAVNNFGRDVLVFGDEASESAHNLSAESSRVIQGKNDTPARQIRESEEGEFVSMSFTIGCHPSKRTYLTVKVESDIENVQTPVLFNGEELAGSDEFGQPVLIGLDRLWGALIQPSETRGAKHSEWAYYTIRLPRYMTEGRNNVDLRFVNQPDKSQPSYPLYRAYTHTEPLFNLPADEDVSADHDIGTVGEPHGEEYVSSLIEEINSSVRELQQGEERLHPRDALGIAAAYSRDDWLETVDKDAVLERIKSSLDSYAIEQAETRPEAIWGPREETGSNWAWRGHGYLAQAYSLLHESFEEGGLLAETLPDHPESDITRREAYTDFFDEALAWRCQNRNIRFYNQSVIISQGLVRMSRALELLNTERAPDRETVDRWIDEAVGLTAMSPHEEGPFHGDKNVARMLQGKSYSPEAVPIAFRAKINRFLVEDGSYYMATDAGTSKERGEYAMIYGAVGLIHTAEMAHETGLKRVKDRVVQMRRAREAMAWWAEDAETGRRTAAVDGTFSSRHTAHPGRKSYGKRPLLIWQAAPHEVTRRWAELSLEHGHEPNFPRHRWQTRLQILWVEAYRALQEEEPSEYVVPMNRERYVWSDEGLGLVTIIDDATHMKMQIGYSARLPGVTGAARVHCHGPQGDRVLTADIDRMDFPFAGQTWTFTPDLSYVDPYFLGQPFNDYVDGKTVEVPWRDEAIRIKSALAGKKLKLAAKPNGEPWPPGEPGIETPDYRAWKGIPFRDYRTSLGIHYRQLRIGPYLIGMNSTGAEKRGFGPGKEYEMKVPAAAEDMRTGEKVEGDTVSVPPRTTKVLKLKTESAN